jgi:hypothetical protein
MSVFFLLLFGAIAPKINSVSNTQATQPKDSKETRVFHLRLWKEDGKEFSDLCKANGLKACGGFRQALDLLRSHLKHTN